MAIIGFVMLSLIWIVAGIKNAVTPKSAPIKDTEDYLNRVMQCNTKEGRRKIL